MKIAIPRERRAGENRVAASPETVKKLKALSLEVVVETGAGLGSNLPDRVYQDAGAEIAPDAASALADADIVLKVQRPLLAGEGDLDELALIKRGALLFAILNPYNSRDHVAAYAAAGVNAFAMEFMPRITRAQVMDVLSSQANLAGYKAVVDAASEYGRAYPMMMTAAGTVPPARAFIMGVGVAGLQAIATAKRLGAIVSATDVRPAVKEQVQSLGGSFVAVENDEFKQAETAGGYAKEMSDDYKRQQAALVAEHIKKQDIVITTALIPGRKAPILVTREHVASMKPGSVLIDLAVEQGGNVEGSELGKVVTTENGVKIVGHANYPSRIAESASLLYAKNLLALLQSLHDKEKGVTLNWDDEIVKAIALTRDGQVVHPAFAGQTV
ncbi:MULTISPECIES: Re/Si-specific NAD(P)(+) transhydrogenase subunit alpha [Azospirillum]|uniref:NAD(P) transhydrogenase subunit alpha part 1 n=1 Tax=Azospirillum argentinense TaxID=2970906 RepID=A0A5B0KSI1_9PROT|nr:MULTISPECIES: Re/Si-specific NAD(P)(+) transhydrogenase subunit alpha [Azospirillum]KAA1054600.1 NAD(P) transhydrogenase alpha subunit [Azospirillum argentinense]MBK3804209.1 Re/Si-specific NAD(P)(+) transhydrogenase subunit alpha [Azospirillum argentinense]UKJ73099.1 Re/Si-specific NAD(P)(+) transhydrogenase subunit alpha [Azospirillum brasilense]